LTFEWNDKRVEVPSGSRERRPAENREMRARIVEGSRHSSAAHMLEGGTYIRYMQELPGHKSSKTMEIYMHVSCKQLGRSGVRWIP